MYTKKRALEADDSTGTATFPRPYQRTKWSPIPILQLPNEVLENIFIRVDDPHTFLNLYKVCHRFHALASYKLNRQRFTKIWFKALEASWVKCYTRKYPYVTPTIFECAAHFIRQHASRSWDKCATKNSMVLVEMKGYRILEIKPGDCLVSWRAVFFGEKSEPENSDAGTYILPHSFRVWDDLKTDRDLWLDSLVRRIEQKAEDCIGLDVEDAVLAHALYDALSKLRILNLETPTVRVRRSYQYLSAAVLFEQDYGCSCNDYYMDIDCEQLK
ncbi:hypothetical protein BJ508DRAFT_300878 [Ascobolus immersus RN42]|uniref:F-box domain-containing protein n=1 Tax=Ascobolus immersus RN42 TaxID=1160509 RepID=A0A3N4ITP0_ASCIM|nr:hypothetical protein BJ508DRAFT_300878 [Ascobolus immersus RN42]